MSTSENTKDNDRYNEHRHAQYVDKQDIDNDQLKPVYRAGFTTPYRDDPPPRRDLLPRRSFLTTTSLIATRGCHNRCDFCYLSTRGLHMPYLMRDVDQIVSEFQADDQPYAVFTDNNLGSKPEYLRQLCRKLRPLQKIWSAAVSIDVEMSRFRRLFALTENVLQVFFQQKLPEKWSNLFRFSTV